MYKVFLAFESPEYSIYDLPRKLNASKQRAINGFISPTNTIFSEKNNIL